MKNLIIACMSLVSFISYCQDFNGIYTVSKIITSIEGEKILFIKNEKNCGIVLMDNDDLIVDKSFLKIELGKNYYFSLDVDLQKYRGDAGESGLVITAENGKIEKIWDVKKDGPLPYIFTAKNLKGLYIQKN